MRSRMALVIGAVLVVGVLADQARSGNREKAVALIDLALRAGGGADKVGKFRAVSFKATELPAKADADRRIFGLIQDAEHVRLTLEQEEKTDFQKGVKFHDVVVINGPKAWMKIAQGKAANELAGAEMAPMKDLFHAICLPDLLIALKQKPYTLTMLDDKNAVGLRVKHPQREEVLLFFDKETGLPTRTRVVIKMGMVDDVTYDIFFSNYKEFQGVKHFTTLDMHFDGKSQFKYQFDELKLLEKVDPGEFRAP